MSLQRQEEIIILRLHSYGLIRRGSMHMSGLDQMSPLWHPCPRTFSTISQWRSKLILDPMCIYRGTDMSVYIRLPLMWPNLLSRRRTPFCLFLDPARSRCNQAQSSVTPNQSSMDWMSALWHQFPVFYSFLQWKKKLKLLYPHLCP